VARVRRDAGGNSRLHTRFATHTLGLFEKHGMETIGYWTEVFGTSNQLVYRLGYPSLESRKRAGDVPDGPRTGSRRGRSRKSRHPGGEDLPQNSAADGLLAQRVRSLHPPLWLSLESVRKVYEGLQSFLSMSRIEASLRNASVEGEISQSLASRWQPPARSLRAAIAYNQARTSCVSWGRIVMTDLTSVLQHDRSLFWC
jgi:hypothetical protein